MSSKRPEFGRDEQLGGSAKRSSGITVTALNRSLDDLFGTPYKTKKKVKRKQK